MDMRHARRVAFIRIACQIDNELTSGGLATDPEVKTDADLRRLEQALDKLRKELIRRAGD